MASPRRQKRLLTAQQKYDLFVRILTGQITQGAAVTEAGVDRTAITRIRTVARNGAVVGLQAEVARLERMVVGQAVELAVGQFQAPTRAQINKPSIQSA